jgi:nucleoside-diphosphate-sugar epimerase
MKTLVIGGTGTVGSQVVRELLARKVAVQVLMRSADNAKGLPAGAEGVVGDLLPATEYKEDIENAALRTLRNVCDRLKCSRGIVVTKKWDDFGVKENLFYMPLPHFLLLFD